MQNILIVEDDFRMRLLVHELLEKEGYTVAATGDGQDAVRILTENPFDVVLTDLKMPGLDGMGILTASKEVNPDSPVIVMTAYATVDSAVRAMRNGAYDYIQKPFDPDELLIVVKRAIDYRKLVDENIRLSAALESCAGDEFIGKSKGAEKIKKFIEMVAPFDTTVLIQGETGSGKEMVARLIHRLSSRASGKFLAVNCGALTETLLEAELFGYERGAFTGALNMKRGLFETADGGTIFLDEINNASQSMQMKLLRVLQDGTVMRVGGVDIVKVDIRILVASNLDLRAQAEKGQFRSDLFYRINVVSIDMPPLRNRTDDIPVLALHFLNRYCNKFSKKIRGFDPAAMRLLTEYPWPGNVRELENTIEHAVIMAQTKEIISIEAFPEEIRKKKTTGRPASTESLRIDEMERSLIEQALLTFKGRKTKAAEALGISLPTLWRKIKKLQLG